MKILFLNGVRKACGVYQYGIRLANCLPMCDYAEVSGEQDYLNAIKKFGPEKIIYNYHAATMDWLNSSNITHTAKNVGIPHESPITIFDELLDIDPLVSNGIPRPLFYEIPTKIMNEEHEFFISYHQTPDVPIFGSFGFGFDNKGFDKIIRYVNEQYDNAIIKMIIPLGDYCGKLEHDNILRKCFDCERKPGIKLMVSTDFFSNEDLLFFLNSNTMNLFLYDRMVGRGISSTIDYALSVDVPIGISDSYMFRNVYDDSICVYKNQISDILKMGTTYVKKFREMYSREKIGEKVIGEKVIGEKVIGENQLCIPVSIGELVDKYSILEIKNKCISDSKKLADIKREMECICICKKYINAYPRFYKQLVYINKKIWDFTDEIKALNPRETPELYAQISSEIFTFNQKRFRLKKYFNDLNDSAIKEQKSYAEDARVITNVNGHYDVIGFLCIEYDAIYVSNVFETDIRQVLPNPNLHFFTGDPPPYPIIDLQTLHCVPEAFQFPPIYYTASGLLGDFITQLSVICENYYKTGQKGILTMTDAIPFRRGLEATYNDIQSIVRSQPYIQEFTIEPASSCDIYLGSWRESSLMYKVNWYELLLHEYGTHFGKHKWIHTTNCWQWNSKVIIHITQYRFPVNLDYSAIVQEHGIENIVFLAMEETDHAFFVEKTGVFIPCVYTPPSFEDLCIAIHSCKLFVGALSMPLTIAHACRVPRIIGFSGGHDDYFNIGLL
jgi:hypothetical protein